MALVRRGHLFGIVIVTLSMVVLSAAEKPARKLPAAAKVKIDFAKQIQPIFQAKCFSCHGPEKQESEFRLDDGKQALAGGENGKAIVPGKSGLSPLLLRVAGLGDDEPMPPKGEGTPLSKEQMALIRAWIDQGAVWPASADAKLTGKGHWSFQPIRRPALLKVKNTKWIRNGIDAFILSKLEREGVQPSPEADRATLIRRLYLDLIGLPPSPADWDKWMNDKRSDWYDRLVAHLLDSPRYGERWARHWLDLARYADSDGYEKDRPRPYAWRWRDWVIKALNDDMPFDEFTIEQLAGDLLPHATLDQKVATGFNRNTLINREGGTDPEEDRVKRTVDRTNTLGAVWLGITVQCAQCHSHKYDPLTQREFYGLYGFFNSLQEPNIGAPLPDQMVAYRSAKAAFDEVHARYVKAIDDYERTRLPAAFSKWEATAKSASPVWTILRPESIKSYKGTKLQRLPDDSILASGPNPGRAEIYTLISRTPLKTITGFRIEAFADDRLPHGGPGRATNGNFHLTMFDVTVQPADGSAPPKSVELTAAAATFSEKGREVAKAINHQFYTGWSVAPRIGKSHIATFALKKPVHYKAGTRLTVTIRQSSTLALYHNLGRFRVSVTGKTAAKAKPLPLFAMTDRVARALSIPSAKRTTAQKQELLDYYRRIDPELIRLRAAADKHEQQAPSNPYQTTKAQIVTEKSPPRKTHLLIRGNFLTPGKEVQPGTPAALPPLKPRGKHADRLDLARWLVSKENPLTARVVVNRVWEHHFGRGIVASLHDFGTQGEKPTHPQLLDWLAWQFRENGWSYKKLHRLIVTSATYRQSSRKRPELAKRDPYNKWLSHQNRLRVEAEIVRDLALSASGLIRHRIGGPSVRPPQPKGVAALGYAGGNKWQTSKGDDRYRRGMYTFFQRTVPYPMLMTFDEPDSNLSCTKRERSNTPLQALTLWNDPVFVECAQAIGRQIVDNVPAAPAGRSLVDQRIRFAFRLCLSRNPSPEETTVLHSLYTTQHRLAASNAKATTELIGVRPMSPEAAADLAAWIIIGRTLMNLDEFITRG